MRRFSEDGRFYQGLPFSQIHLSVAVGGRWEATRRHLGGPVIRNLSLENGDWIMQNGRDEG